MSEVPKLHVDDNWKQQAAKEKERLGGQPAAAEEAPAPAVSGEPAAQPETPRPQEKASAHRGAIPAASFSLIVQQFTTQALMAFGVIQHPITHKAEKDMEVAKHYIDMLAVLAEKTKGNLTAEEQKLLDATLYELRMTYVELAKKG